MKKLLIVKSIFIPNNEYMNICFRSITNLLESIGNDTNIIITGWCKLKKYESLVKKINDNIFKYKNVSYDIFFLNYGKYHLLNKLKEYIKDNEYIMYLDHDILVTTKIFDSLNNISQLFTQKDMGILFFNQSGDSRHQITIYDNIVTEKDIKLANSSLIGDIGSGAFIISKEIVKMIELKNYPLYGIDDIYLCRLCRKNNKLYYVLKEYYVEHPIINSNIKYEDWKKKMIIHAIKHYNYEANNFIINDYNIDIQESNNLW